MSATAAARHADPGPLPRPLLWVGVPLAGMLLVALFVFLGFPYDLLREALAAQVSAASGARIAIAELAPRVSPLGPALEARGVSAELPDGTRLRLDRARLRPAWSLSWLRGAPALAVDLAAPEGRLHGTLYAGGEPGFDGALEGVVLKDLPLEAWVPDLALDGLADADVDVVRGEAGPTGRVALHAREGSVGLPGLPVALPFARFEADAELGADGRLLRVERLVLDGPMLAVEGEGELGAAARVEAAPLSGHVRLDVRESGVRPMIQGLGIRLDRDGRAEATLSGTLGQPRLR